MISLVNLSMEKNVDDSPQEILVWTKTYRVSLVNLRMDKNVEDIVSKSQYGQKRRGYPQ